MDKSLLKSAVQKNVRRMRRDPALRCAKALIEQDRVDAFRRVPIIVVEDCILHPQYMPLVRVMVDASQKDYVENIDADEFILSIISDISQVVVRDAFWMKERPTGFAEQAIGKLPHHQAQLVRALQLRAKFGGMKSDIWMLHFLADLWAERFAKNPEGWLGIIEKAYAHRYDTPSGLVKWDEVGPLQPGDVPTEAVDMHCSPVVNILAKKAWVQNIIKSEKRFGPDADVKKVVSDAIWSYRSALNERRDIELEVDTREAGWELTLEKKDKLAEVYNRIEKTVDRLSLWWLEKQEGGQGGAV